MFNFFKKKSTIPENAAVSDTILIVEDNEVDRTLIQRILEKKNYKVLTAVNGEEGVKIAQEQKVNLILLDFQLPGMNGVQVCSKLKNDSQTKNIPIIFLTVIKGEEIIDFYEAGAEAYIHKPINPKQLLKEVELMLTESKAIG